jgi:branched-chain amino acid transport system permease protein
LTWLPSCLLRWDEKEVIPISIHALLLQAFIGLSLGSIYVMMASGLSLIFGLMRVVNFAHGSFYMLGAYTLVYLISLIGNFWLCLIVAPILIGILGILIEVGGIRRLYGTEEFNPLLFTLGLNYVFVDIIRILFGLGGIGSSIPKGLTGMVNLGFMMFPKYRFFMILAGAAVVVLIWLFINRTNIGMVVRAGTKDNEMVQMLGINVRLVWTLIFGLGIALAALSGALIAPITGTIPEMGMFMVIEAFVVVVIGGMGSFAGSIVAGILVGEVIAITNLFYPQAGTVAIFILMAIILLTTKAGLFGEG